MDDSGTVDSSLRAVLIPLSNPMSAPFHHSTLGSSRGSSADGSNQPMSRSTETETKRPFSAAHAQLTSQPQRQRAARPESEASEQTSEAEQKQSATVFSLFSLFFSFLCFSIFSIF